MGALRASALPYEDLETRSLWWLQRHRGEVSIGQVLLRAATVGSEAQNRAAARLADLVLRPPADQIALLHWRAIDRAIDLGYRHTVERLEDGDFAASPGG